MSRKSISIVSPVYKAENCLEELYKRLKSELESITDDYEIIFVNDASPDSSFNIMKTLAKSDTRVKCLNLSKNHGQHYAIFAGLSFSSKEWIVVMDCDLQDRPEEIKHLYHETSKGSDIVLAQRQQRKDTMVKRFQSYLFNKTLSLLSGVESDPSIGNFGIYHRRVINTVLNTKELIKYFPASISRCGFQKAKYEVQHDSRFLGESSYTLSKLLKLAFDAILSNSQRPVKLIFGGGLLLSFCSFVFALRIIYKALHGEISVLGYPSIIVSVWLIGGILISFLGFIGIYIVQTFEQTKYNPSFIVAETINLSQPEVENSRP